MKHQVRDTRRAGYLLYCREFRGLVQTIFVKHNVILTFGGRGKSHDVLKIPDWTLLVSTYLYCTKVVNPLRMRRRVTAVCVCVCLSVTTLVASLLSYTAQMRYQCFQYDNSKVFNSWILLKLFCSKVMVLSTLTLTCRRHFLPYIA